MYSCVCRSRCPRGLRCGCAATRLLGFWARIPPGYVCPFLVSIVCCQVEVSATGRSPVQRSATDCGVSECDREASIMRRPWPTGGCCATGKFLCIVFVILYELPEDGYTIPEMSSQNTGKKNGALSCSLYSGLRLQKKPQTNITH
jgi:hypothetical protein